MPAPAAPGDLARLDERPRRSRSAFVHGFVGSVVVIGLLGVVTAVQLGRLERRREHGFRVAHTLGGAGVIQIPLRWSNAFLVTTTPPVLVDAGSAGDEARLERALADHGVRAEGIGAVILTHVRADHAGLVSWLKRRAGARVLVGAGDRETARRGRNDPLRPTSAFARVLSFFVPDRFEPFRPDLVISAPLDLAPFGLVGEVVPMPGHTPGTQAVILDGRLAFVGDMVFGGSFGGALAPGSPGEPYFQADAAANLRGLQALVDRRVQLFLLGHGGPVTRSAVIAAFHLRATPRASILAGSRGEALAVH